jgi:pullulanase/glycogen debranching enzyme
MADNTRRRIKNERLHCKNGCERSARRTVHPEGVNFSVFSKNATRIELLLFDKDGIIMDLLAVELMARAGRDPSEL